MHRVPRPSTSDTELERVLSGRQRQLPFHCLGLARALSKPPHQPPRLYSRTRRTNVVVGLMSKERQALQVRPEREDDGQGCGPVQLLEECRRELAAVSHGGHPGVGGALFSGPIHAVRP